MEIPPTNLEETRTLDDDTAPNAAAPEQPVDFEDTAAASPEALAKQRRAEAAALAAKFQSSLYAGLKRD